MASSSFLLKKSTTYPIGIKGMHVHYGHLLSRATTVAALAGHILQESLLCQFFANRRNPESKMSQALTRIC